MPVSPLDTLFALLTATPQIAGNQPTAVSGSANNPQGRFDLLLAAIEGVVSKADTSLASIGETNQLSTLRGQDLPDIPSDTTLNLLGDGIAVRLVLATPGETVIVASGETTDPQSQAAVPTLSIPLEPIGTEVRPPALLETPLTQSTGIPPILFDSVEAVDSPPLPESFDPLELVEEAGSVLPATLTSTPTVLPISVPTAARPVETVRVASRLPSVLPQAPIIARRSEVIPAEMDVKPSTVERPPAEPVGQISQTSAATASDDRPLQFREPLLVATDARAAAPRSTAPSNNFTRALEQVDRLAAPEAEATAAPLTNRLPDEPIRIPAPPRNAPAITPLPTTRSEANGPDVSAASTTPRIEKSLPQTPIDPGTSGELFPTISTSREESFPRPQSTDRVGENPISLASTTIADPPAERVELVEQTASGIPQPPSANTPNLNANIPANPNSRPIVAQLNHAIVEHAAVTARDGQVEFQVRLDPPELGPVRLKLVAHGDRMSAEVVVSNDAIRTLVESQLPELRARLEQAGINLPDVDVSAGGGRHRQDAETGDERPRTNEARVMPTPARIMSAVTSVSGSGTLDITV